VLDLEPVAKHVGRHACKVSDLSLRKEAAMSVLGRFDCLSVLGTAFIHLHWPEVVTFLDRCIGVPNPELSEQIHST
jgi:hypothetical protein